MNKTTAKKKKKKKKRKKKITTCLDVPQTLIVSSLHPS